MKGGRERGKGKEESHFAIFTTVVAKKGLLVPTLFPRN
jgi:hypothetical protein